MTVAIGRAARSGVLVKGGDTLEALAVPSTLILDKTGTLTEGRPALLHWCSSAAVRAAVLALERHSTHPVAVAFAETWPEVAAAVADDVRVELGAGVSGLVAGVCVRVGSPAWIARHARGGETLPEPDRAAAWTPVWVAFDDRIVARAGFGDCIRPEAAATVARLRAQGWQLELLSGDDPAVVAATGRALGFAPEAMRGGASPEDKRAVVEARAKVCRVVMVGDGVNDAAAIAAATVGVGVSGGAEACLAAADVYLSKPGVAALGELADGAQRTLRVIRQGLGLSLAWNVVGAGLAVAGLVTPLVAAVAMPLSSVCVVVLARSGQFDDTGTPASRVLVDDAPVRIVRAEPEASPSVTKPLP